jgi:hypothetical protein
MVAGGACITGQLGRCATAADSLALARRGLAGYTDERELMEEGNGEIPLTGDPHVDAALQRIKGKFKDLEDAMLVQVHLEARHAKQTKGHALWLEDNDQRHAKFVAEHELAVKNLDIKLAEITEKMNFLFDREMRKEGGPENQR